MKPLAVLVAIVLAADAGAADKPVARLGSTRLRHTDQPLTVAFSPDGAKLYSGGKDGVLRVWSVAAGEPLAATPRTSSHILKLTFVQNGKRLAALYSDGGLYLLDPATLAETHEMILDRPSAAGVSADAAYAVVSEQINTLTVYDVKTGLAKLELPEGPAAAMSPDGTSVAAADTTGSVTLFRTAGGKPLLTVFHSRPATDIQFRSDGKLFATASEKTGVRIWEPGREKPLLDLEDAAAPVQFVGSNRIAASHKGGIGVFDIGTKKWTHHVAEPASAFAVSADGTKLAAVGATGNRVRLWNLATGEQLHAVDDRFANVSLLVPAADGRSVVGVGGTHAFRWALGESRAKPLGSLAEPPVDAASNGRRLVAAYSGSIAVWDSFDPSKPLAKPSRTIAVPGGATAVALSKDGKQAAFGNAAKRIAIFDPARGDSLHVLPVAAAACELAFTPDGSRLVILGRDGWLRVWRLGTDEGEVWKHRFARNQTGCLAVSADGRRIAAATANQLTAFDADAGEVLLSVEKAGTNSYFRSAAFTPDGRRLVAGTAGMDGAVQVWSVESVTEVKRLATGGIARLALAADGRTLFTSGDDETISVWALPAK